ncbi:DUF4184 family protein [Pseudonocardia nematodicida]|uniref:DUF4184 family protein n=1 Tax=Pseudonocardia nematodicida TaxID=1206997 RepID=A0ABV1KI06_9PSEU
MPFTLAHPAAVVPLLRGPFVPPALVCGALAPDVPYFLGTLGIPRHAQAWYEPFLNATTSHGLSGLWVSTTCGLVLLGLYGMVRRPVGAVSPFRFRPGAPTVPLVRRAGWVLPSVLIGVLTHVLWDSLTHNDGAVVPRLDVLSTPLAGGLTAARALQHLSTVAGLVVVAMCLRRRVERVPADRAGHRLSSGSRRGALAGLALATLAGAVLATGRSVLAHVGTAPADDAGQTPREWAELVLADSAKGGGAALVAALLVHSGLWWAYRARRRRRCHHQPNSAHTSGGATTTDTRP